MTDATAIKKITLKGVDYQLTITGLDEPLVVPEEVIHRHRLVENIVLTKSQLLNLQAEAELLACDRKASQILSLREHSVGEFEVKLRRKDFSAEAIKATVSRYRQLGLLDDVRYARLVAESSLKRNPSGRSYLMAVLQKKHIARSLAERTVDSLLQGLDEVALAVQSLEKRWTVFGQLELERARKKAYNYLSRRGVSYAAAKAAFERLYDEKRSE
jgi:SOS response regulatory protein OraA/RecX